MDHTITWVLINAGAYEQPSAAHALLINEVPYVCKPDACMQNIYEYVVEQSVQYSRPLGSPGHGHYIILSPVPPDYHYCT